MTPTLQPTAAESQILATAHATGHTTLTLEDLRRNRSRAMASAMRQAERALQAGDVARANTFIALAAAVEHDGQDHTTTR